MKSGVVKVGRASVPYYGSENDAPTVLLIHGTGGTFHRHFGEVLPDLLEKYRVVGMDLVTPTDGDIEELFDHFVDQVQAVVEADSKGGTLTVVGYSLGALIASAYAARAASPVGALVLINGWVRADPFQQVRNSIWRELYNRDRNLLSRFNIFTSYSPEFLNNCTPSEVSQLIYGMSPDPVRNRQMELNASVDIRGVLAGIRCPTMVIAGEQDITVPLSQARALVRGVSDSRLEIIPSGHAAIAETPARVVDLITAFDARWQRASNAVISQL